MWSVVSFVFKESLKGSRKYSWLRYTFSGIGAAFSFIQFGALAMIVNEFTRHGVSGARMSVLAYAFGLIIASNILPSVVNSLQGYYSGIQSNDLQRYLQERVFLKMDTIDVGTVEQPEFQNMADIALSRGWGSFFSVISIITNSLRNIIALIIAMVSLLLLSPLAALIIFIGALPVYFFEKKNAELSALLWTKSSERRRIASAKSGPILGKNSLTELKNFELVQVFLNKWKKITETFHRELDNLNLLTAKNEIITTIILAVAYCIAFVLIIMKVYSGALLVGSLVFSFSVISRFQTALNALFENFGNLTEHRKNINILMDCLGIPPMVVGGSRILDPSGPIKIELKNIAFAYPGENPREVIENISLTINSGDSIAIVGLNGAGKTTLIKLLTRVYDPTKGEILVNGIPLYEYDLGSWKRCLGILLQDYSVYSEESVGENIMFGNFEDQDLERAKKIAEETTADEYIKGLPDSYDQKVGTEFRGGVELSKGQKQKLALTRVLYRNAPIVILDEPTAAVDALSEDVIFKNIRANHNGQTRIIISHKFSNVRDADKIILIQDGKILEQGTHDELMKKRKGKYRELFELQAEGYR